MKFSFKSFAIGFGCAALSLGAVTYANAASNKTLKACANNSTGVMRYISKGSCKKTESLLSWNQMGPQGVPGAAGVAGASGAKGETGAAGTSGTTFHVIDSAGRDLGVPIGVYDGGQTADVLFEQGIWTISNTAEYPLQGRLRTSGLFYDGSCSTPIWAAPNQQLVIPAMRGVIPAFGSEKYVAPVGRPFLASSLPVVYGRFGPFVNADQTCVASTNQTYVADFAGYLGAHVTQTQNVTPPTFTAPFTLVAK